MPRTASTAFLLRMSSVAFSGFVVSALVATLAAATQKPGIVQAASDLYKHAAYVHPFLISVFFGLVTLTVVLQGADFLDGLDTKIIVPTLEFFVHLFAIGVGAVIPVGLYVGKFTGFCENTIALGLVVVALSVFASLACLGLHIVELRASERENPLSTNGSAKLPKYVLWFYAVLFLVSVWGGVSTADERSPTEGLMSGLQTGMAQVVCGKP